MQYMLLIYEPEDAWQGLSEEESNREFQAYFTLTEELRASGKLVAGDPLEPVEAAGTVRVRDGERSVTDGPFAETKEQLGGYYLIDVESQDEAFEWAAKIPAAKRGSVEVRPIMQIAVPQP